MTRTRRFLDAPRARCAAFSLALATALLSSFAFVPPASAAPVSNASKAAVVYFSQYDNTDPDSLAAARKASRIDAVGGASLTAPGLTGLAAERAARVLGVEPHALAVLDRYPAPFSEVLARVEAERDANARPALDAEKLAAALNAVGKADVVVLAAPNWSYTLPGGLLTFLDAARPSLDGKTVLPVIVHGTGGFAGTLDALAKALPETRIAPAVSLERGKVQEELGRVDEALAQLEKAPGA